MNIFVIYSCPAKAAQHATDKHTVKMPLESGQMLANCFDPKRLADKDCPRTKKGTIRKHSYYNHPCSIWVRESRENMRWVIEWAKRLDEERMIRFNSEREHFTLSFIRWCENNIQESLVPEGRLTKFTQCMEDEFKHPDSIIAYRNYYRYDKALTHTWKRNKPGWINE